MSEVGIIDNIKNVIVSLGVGIVGGAVGGAVFPIYLLNKGKIKISTFFINIVLGAFVGYVIGEILGQGKYTGPICAVAGCVSMKIFEFVEVNFNAIVRGVISKKTGITLDTNKKPDGN